MIGFHRRNMRHKELAITHKAAVAGVVVDLSMRPSELALPEGQVGPTRPTILTVSDARAHGAGAQWRPDRVR